MIKIKRLSIILIAVLCIFPFVISLASNKRVIVIDAGHDGVYDKGASVGNVHEGIINLQIALKLQKILKDNDYEVVMTREGENHLCKDEFIKKEDMNKRCQIINESNCDIFISIHLNTFPSSAYKGAEVYYNDKYLENENLANIILNQIKLELNNTKREIKKANNLYLLKNVTRPGCLIECGFMSNPEELNMLVNENYQNRLSLAIFNGIEQYLSIV